MTTMDQYIDVVGQAEYKETVGTYRADLDLTVRAAKNETAMAEVADLRQACLRALLAAGLTGEEMSEGGGQAYQPWYWRRKDKVGQEASLRVLLAVDDMVRLQKALAALEPLFTDQARRVLSVGMRPEFAPTADARAAAEQEAIADARSRAERLASAAKVRILGAAQVEQLDVTRSRTGMHGDEDWRGFMVGAAAAGGLAEAEADVPLDAASRTTTVRFRVRFATQVLDGA